MVLEAQLAQMERNDERLLTTVYWALTFVGSVVLALLVMNFYGAHALQQREIKIIQTELQNEFSQRFAIEMARIHEEVDARFRRSREEVAAEARNEDDKRGIELIERLTRGSVAFHPDDVDRACVHLDTALRYGWDLGASFNLMRCVLPYSEPPQWSWAEELANRIDEPNLRAQLLQEIASVSGSSR